MIILASTDAVRQIGTALNIRSMNRRFLSSSSLHEPRYRLPPDENGEIAVACAPITMLVNRMIPGNEVVSAIAGTIGKSAGHTTPSVLLKKDMMPPITANAIGKRYAGILVPTHPARIWMVPALIATEISIPTPQIMISVPHGTLVTACFSSAKRINRARTAIVIEIKPISILVLMNCIV